MMSPEVRDHDESSAGYWAVRRDTALVAPMHDLVWVTGPDAVTFLQGILSQDVAAMNPGDVARSFLLGPQGKLVALLWVLRGDGRVGLVTDTDQGKAVAENLGRYRIRVKAQIEVDPRPRFEVWGAGIERQDWVEGPAGLVAGLPLPSLGRELRTGEPPAGPMRAGADAVTAVRVEEGEPVMGRDVDQGTIPQETGLVDQAVSFTKGCFLGQELVARIASRGHVNRHLRGVVIEGGTRPPEGAEVFFGELRAGALTSVSHSPGLGAAVALALLRREVEPGARVVVRVDDREVSATVRGLPMTPGR